MFQAVQTPTMPARNCAMFDYRRVQAACLRSRIEAIRERVELLYERAGHQHPLVTLMQVEQQLEEPIEALQRDAGYQMPARVGKLLADTLYELGAIGSIGDTLDPIVDREHCIDCAEQALDEARRFLAAAAASLRS